MATTLVTGGAGFIGSHLVRALFERGDQVRVLDNLSTGREENLDGLDVEMIVGDIQNEKIVEQSVKGVERIYHLAARVSVPASMQDPIRWYETNLNGSLNVLWAAYDEQVSCVILASSAAVYGETHTVVEEDAPKEPLSPYAASKLAMEQAARLFADAYQLPTVSLRFFNVYGPRQSPDSPYAAAIPLFIQAMLSGEQPTIFGDGLQRRDFVFVEDAVRALLLATERDEAIGGIFNVGGGGAVSILDLVQALQQIIPEAPDPVYSSPREGDIRLSEANLERIYKALGYRPTIDLKRGLETTVQWFLSKERLNSE